MKKTLEDWLSIDAQAAMEAAYAAVTCCHDCAYKAAYAAYEAIIDANDAGYEAYAEAKALDR
jgi:hypothetical protein